MMLAVRIAVAEKMEAGMDLVNHASAVKGMTE